MSQQHDIYVRAYAVRLDEKRGANGRQDNGPKWPDCALVFDCESRITADQTLTFGFWRFCELRNDRLCMHRKRESFTMTMDLAQKNSMCFANTQEPQSPIRLTMAATACGFTPVQSLSRRFSGWRFRPRRSSCVSICRFDLSRLAVDWNPAKNGGWSLIMSQWRNPKTGKVEAE